MILFKIKEKPYNLLAITGFILVLLSLIVLSENNVVDFHLHDTYFIVAHTHIFWLFAFILFFLWLLYLCINKLLYTKLLTWLHVIITIVSAISFGLIFYFGNIFLGKSIPKYHDLSNWQSSDIFNTTTKSLTIIISILFLVQLFFLANIIFGLFNSILNSKRKNS
jgi:heme/copper-type cytochrome/quinol oxidase subunit 1